MEKRKVDKDVVSRGKSAKSIEQFKTEKKWDSDMFFDGFAAPLKRQFIAFPFFPVLWHKIDVSSVHVFFCQLNKTEWNAHIHTISLAFHLLYKAKQTSNKRNNFNAYHITGNNSYKNISMVLHDKPLF